MKRYNILGLLIVMAAFFGYYSSPQLPSPIGLMIPILISSLLAIGRRGIGASRVTIVSRLLRVVNFHAVLMQVMLSFLLFQARCLPGVVVKRYYLS
jgi:CPA1 family monovalent cation:H+ antiporter